MKRDVITVNDFYKNPDEIVRYAMTLRYYNPWVYNFRGSSAPEDMIHAVTRVSFFKKAKDCPFKSSQELIAAFENITGEEVDVDHWNLDFPENPEDGTVITPRPNLIDPAKDPRFDNIIPNSQSCRWNCVFQVKHLIHEPGTHLHNHDHDTWNSVGTNGWVGIIYFNKLAPRDSGLKTFKNTHGDDYEWGTAADRWELVDDFANVYNRLVLIRGNVPHAGGSGWGDSVENGRLYQTFFFKTKVVKDIEACPIQLPVQKMEK